LVRPWQSDTIGQQSQPVGKTFGVVRERDGWQVSEIVDLQRYPVADVVSEAAQATIAGCRAALSQDGLCLLPRFVNADALSAMCGEARALTGGAHYTEHWRATPNGVTDGAASVLPKATRASISAIACDRLDAASPLRMLYEWDGLTRFIAAVLNDGPLYRTTDPLVSCMLTVFGDADELGWHYDPNDNVVSLLLQEPDSGGEFEFAPAVRGDREAERAVLDGRYDNLVSPRLIPGTLSLFNGYRSLHRVAPVAGEKPRIIALFNYSQQPGYVFSDDTHHKFFGRLAKAG